MLWQRISRAGVSGQVRSLLWKLLHQRLALLQHMWVRNYYGVTEHCVLCGLEEETYTHLFFDCPFTQSARTVVSELLLTMQLPVSWAQDEWAIITGATQEVADIGVNWPDWGVTDPPTPQSLSKWAGNCWTEIRGILANVLWTTRNLRLHSAPDAFTQSQIQSIVTSKVWAALRSLAVSKLRPPVTSHRRGPSTAGRRFSRVIWERLAKVISAKLNVERLFAE